MLVYDSQARFMQVVLSFTCKADSPIQYTCMQLAQLHCPIAELIPLNVI